MHDAARPGASARRADAAGVELRELYARELAARNFSADAAQLAALEKLVELRGRLLAARRADAALLRRWLRPLRGAHWQGQRGLYLCGGVGRGKTWLMDLFYQSLPFAEARRRHFHRFMHDAHAELKRLRNRQAPLESVAARIAREARVLCFDEFAVADIADAMILAGLLAGLFARGVTLVATSNVRPRDLYQGGLQRERFVPAIELLERHVEVITIGGATDYRLRTLTQAGVYLRADAPDADARLTALFESLAHQGDWSTEALEIDSRPIEVVRRGAGVVWFDFATLCRGPRSQEDYIEIAREYRSVIVSAVPCFDTSTEDEARRFIALVDELYDHNVNLIVSARAAPPQLYHGERLGREFQRTASRLIEMQSEEYLAREHRP
ncbi:MAG TPA: cell division protein ZapE [Steroidobacteraceae bacterium]|nr:cell division protein ZapE [Steroidobacteraceae bacterium]